MVKKIGILIGSLRNESFSKKIANALKTLAPASFEMEEVEIGDLSIYNQDFDDEGNPPSSWTEFRERVKKFDAILFITPEYNRSVPAVLKNALDVGSRPYGKNVWDGKPGAVVSVSPGGLSGFGANHHLRQSLVFLNVPTMQQPEAYIGNATTLFDVNGALINESSREFLQKFMDAFAAWVETNVPKKF
ncbi:Quinone reductase [Sporomusa silvacetica DSM 10669]|uniref:Quinone reductase n=1 Tax=Sporomusa silvacetica DSM 10669 TaxID=1123289 RepID=A0ABZ3IHU4_9FIRM|nr:NAD(P)H-dependent oxidoreductase [Sporomusa silvacetica]OZC16772.1 FMN-dependent NADPH-azoreductase [Sporomusa silvacetica DSM 10669]